MTWKVWVIVVGLGLQVLSVIPAYYFAFKTKKFNSVDEMGSPTEVGIPIRIEERLDRNEKACLFVGFFLVAVGAALQILGEFLA